MGAAEDPYIDDYYDKSHECPLTYSPEEDPEVIEEMRVAAVELERGENNSEGEDDSDGWAGIHWESVEENKGHKPDVGYQQGTYHGFF